MGSLFTKCPQCNQVSMGFDCSQCPGCSNNQYSSKNESDEHEPDTSPLQPETRGIIIPTEGLPREDVLQRGPGGTRIIVSPTTTYTITKNLGSGSFGDVYLGITSDGKKFAVKKILKDKLKTEQDIENIKSEIEINKRLSYYLTGCNPNIICYKESIEDRDNIYIVSEYIDGQDMYDYYTALTRISEPIHYRQLKNIMDQALTGLADIHNHDYAHRDIKLENMIITDRNEIVIIDFGFACNVCRNNVGSMLYVPHEILTQSINNMSQEKALFMSQKHDIWSMGIVFYLLANKRTPYGKTVNSGELTKRIINFQIYESTYPNKQINDIIHKMLQYNPNDRSTVMDALNMVRRLPD